VGGPVPGAAGRIAEASKRVRRADRRTLVCVDTEELAQLERFRERVVPLVSEPHGE
jgi:hypothetical protein